MRQAIVLVLVMMAAAAGAPSSAPQPLVQTEGLLLEPSLSVAFNGDASFVGHPMVHSGSGTAEDPYVISHLAIAQDRPYGLRFVNTRVHVLVHDVHILGYASDHWDECSLDDEFCDGDRGLEVTNVSNVTARNVRVEWETWGIYVRDAHNITLENVVLGRPAPYNPSYQQFFTGIRVGWSKDVRFVNVSVHNGLTPAYLTHSARVEILASEFMNATHGASVGHVESLHLQGNRFDRGGFYATAPIIGLTAVGNTFTRGDGFNAAYYGGTLHGALLCGNLFTGIPRDHEALQVKRGSDLRIVGNVFDGNHHALSVVWSVNASVETNVVRDTVRAVGFNGTDLEVHGNVFEDIGEGVAVKDDVDIARNWWGSPTGPGGDGPGAGTPLYLATPGIPYEPWLTSPPDLDADCAKEEAAFLDARTSP